MKGKPTVRHELKRIDSKRARAAEDAVLRGDHTKLVRTAHWGVDVNNRQPPILDEVALKGKQRPKKAIEYCPKREALGEHNKRHYYIVREVPHRYFCEEQPRMRKIKQCMYCGIQVRQFKKGWY